MYTVLLGAVCLWREPAQQAPGTEVSSGAGPCSCLNSLSPLTFGLCLLRYSGTVSTSGSWSLGSRGVPPSQGGHSLLLWTLQDPCPKSRVAGTF